MRTTQRTDQFIQNIGNLYNPPPQERSIFILQKSTVNLNFGVGVVRSIVLLTTFASNDNTVC